MRSAKIKIFGVCLVTLFLSGLAIAQGEDQQLLERIKTLEARLAELEGKALTSEGTNAVSSKVAIIGGTNEASKSLEWLTQNKISGFASVSYLHNFDRRASSVAGRSFDINDGFSLNKFKVTFEKPVEFTPEKWDAGYRADLIFGQDAALIQSGYGKAPAGGTPKFNLGDHGDLEQLFATVNVPIGRGLQVSAGKMVTLMGVEVIEETANPNFSEGNQFLFVENFTSTGVQLNYKWSDKIDTQIRVFNGWDVVKDNNSARSYMGRIGFAPDDKTSLALIAYGGPEQDNNSSAWRKGIEFVGSRKITSKLTAWVQGDYGREDKNPVLPVPTKDAEWWAGGAWLSYDFCDKVGLALRGDYLNDKEGARTSGSPFTSPIAANTGMELSSFTLTLNWKPYKGLQVRPEMRWDTDWGSVAGGAFNARRNQFTAGLGIAYLF
ncbi:MAG: porin [Verrucomicrobiota bacterium]|nr:porin [Verrucomicrobiota bacterium]